MPYDLGDKLVIGVASSALFDLSESDAVFRLEGVDAYRRYQEENISNTLAPGVAFPFIKRLLALNHALVSHAPSGVVEVIVLSRNDPDTGLRVMRSLEAHGLDMTRAVFCEGKAPFDYMPAFSMSLFLSANEDDVRAAAQGGHPAGYVTRSESEDDSGDLLRIAFDFDGVLASDESERISHFGTLEAFHDHEAAHAAVPLQPGPLKSLLEAINRIQEVERKYQASEPSYEPRVRVSLVTARNAPSHERAVRSLKDWGVTVNDAFFLGGIDKAAVLGVLKPHIFFDDSPSNIASTAPVVPSVHVPFGVLNEQATDGEGLLPVAPSAQPETHHDGGSDG